MIFIGFESLIKTGICLDIYGEYSRQYIIKNGRIDILAIDKKKNFYVIELKKRFRKQQRNNLI